MNPYEDDEEQYGDEEYYEGEQYEEPNQEPPYEEEGYEETEYAPPPPAPVPRPPSGPPAPPVSTVPRPPITPPRPPGPPPKPPGSAPPPSPAVEPPSPPVIAPRQSNPSPYYQTNSGRFASAPMALASATSNVVDEDDEYVEVETAPSPVVTSTRSPPAPPVVETRSVRTPPAAPPVDTRSVRSQAPASTSEEFINPITSNAAHPPSQKSEVQGQEERRSSLLGVKTKENMPSLGGLNSVSKGNVEIPAEVAARILLKDENILGQFDVFYVEKKLSPRVQFYLTIFTLGLYQLYQFFKYIGRLLRHLCCACKECEDSVYFNRGKIIVTNRGRVIYWETLLEQHNGLNRKTYTHVHSKTQIFHVDDIAQTSLVYSDRLLCLNCCYHDYFTGIDVTFYRYDQQHTPPKSPYLTTSKMNDYLILVQRQMLEKFVATKKWLLSYGDKEPVTIRILSNPDDHIYDGEYALEPLEDLTRFHIYLNELFTNSRMEYYFSKTKTTVRGYDYPAPGTDEANPPVFLSIRAATDLDRLRKFGDESGTSVAHGVKDVHPDLSNFTLVDEDGNVTIPQKWIPLSKGEEIISAVGFGYQMTTFDYLLSIITFGLYYLRCLRPIIIRRAAYVLTTHRIVEILLVQGKGKVPAELGSVDLFVRSYLPKEILSGHIQSQGLFCYSSLLTVHGTITLRIPSTHFIFAQKMQLATSRYPEVPIADIPDLEHQQLNETIQSDIFQNYQESIESNPFEETVPYAADRILDHSSRKYLTNELTPFEKLLYPLIPSETLLIRFQSGAQYLPFYSLGWGKYLIRFFYEHPNHQRWFGLVNLVRCLTFCTRPYVTVNSSVVTNHTFFYTSTTETLQQIIDENILDTANDKSGAAAAPPPPAAAAAVTPPAEGSSAPEDLEAGAMENIYQKSHASTQSHKRSSAQSKKRGSVPTELDTKLGKTVMSSCSCCGPPSRYFLDPFVLVWVPIHAIRSQELTIETRGAKPFAEKLLCCELESRSFISRYVLNIDTKYGLAFNFAEDFPYKAWIKDRRLAFFQSTIGAIQSYTHSHSHPNI